MRLSGRTVGDVVKLNIAEALDFFGKMTLPDEARAIADKILVEIRQRLRFLNDVVLEYLTLIACRRRCLVEKRSDPRLLAWARS